MARITHLHCAQQRCLHAKFLTKRNHRSQVFRQARSAIWPTWTKISVGDIKLGICKKNFGNSLRIGSLRSANPAELISKRDLQSMKAIVHELRGFRNCEGYLESWSSQIIIKPSKKLGGSWRAL